jgi:hypothetical protein
MTNETVSRRNAHALAEMIDVPAENLKKTVVRYKNSLAGDDTDFVTRTEMLYLNLGSPDLGLKWAPALLDVFGVRDRRELKRSRRRQPADPRLYAVGNAAGGKYAEDYPSF